jgi:hypothetical protein
MKYKIYKLIYENKVVYVGRTKMTLKQRGYVGYSHNIHINKIYKDCSMELIEETDDISRERYWINYYKETVLNIQKGDGLNHKEYQKEYWNKEDNKERLLKRQKLAVKKYRENNPEKYKLSQQKYKNKIKKQNER